MTALTKISEEFDSSAYQAILYREVRQRPKVSNAHDNVRHQCR
jgi:hypothetical protein